MNMSVLTVQRIYNRNTGDLPIKAFQVLNVYS